MDFEILSEITGVEIIAAGRSVRERKRLQRAYGGKKWRKLKGFARVKFSGNAKVSVQEVHWYEANGVGKKEFKIKYR